MLEQIIQILSAPAFTALVVTITAIIALWELREMTKSRKVTAFLEMYKLLQDEKIREARGSLIELGRSGKNFPDWTAEEKKSAETASQAYDMAGMMVNNHLIGKKLIINERRDSIIKCWEAAVPMIKKYQEERGKDFWNDFEKIYYRAKKLKIPEKTNEID